MDEIGTFPAAEKRILSDLRECIGTIRDLAGQEISDIQQGIATLSDLRKSVYEDVNQIQHEEMVLHAAQHLQSSACQGLPVNWSWNPRQTGNITEPDLRGTVDGQIVVSAEITTSERPVGTIDRRMAKTLKKLDDMPGKRYYFVRTDSMAQRARTKVEKSAYEIEVVQI